MDNWVLDLSPFSLTTGLIGLKMWAKNIIVSKSWHFFSWSLTATVCSAVHALHPQKIALRHRAYVMLWE